MGLPDHTRGPDDDEPSSELTSAAPVVDDRFKKLFEAHFDMVWRTLRRLGVGAEALDDATQEVFIVASRKVREIEPGKEKAFLYGTTVRVASTARRTQGRRLRVSDEAPEIEVTRPDELLDQKRARAILDEIVSALPDDLRAIFVLFELEGLTMIEIASVLEVPQGTVASRLRRGRSVFEAAVARLDASNKRRKS